MNSRVNVTWSVTAAALIFLGSSVPAVAGGSVSGTVDFTGDAPQRREVKMSADPACEAANGGEARLGEMMVINDGKVQNVFVYVKDGLGDATFEVPAAPVEMDQNGCMYSPHVVGAMAGQTIVIKNSDATLHNVHSLPENSKPFNSAMPMKGMTIKKKFSEPEVMVRMKCDVHPWMSAYVGVLPHPFYGVSGADGTFKIDNLPAGTYTIEAWHEKFGTQTQSVTVGEGGSATADFSYAPKG